MRFGRVDHVVLQVPDIDRAHKALLALGFDEAWPIGRNWPHGPTSGIALGGINLELLQPDEDPPESPALAEIVFTPKAGHPMEAYGRVVEKIEADPQKLAARGFPEPLRRTPQKICTNAFPGSESPWPHFVCEYGPILANRLSAGQYAAPYGLVRRIEIGALRARARFLDPPPSPDLGRFLAKAILTTGPKLCEGEDRVRFWTDGAALNLRDLTIEA